MFLFCPLFVFKFERQNKCAIFAIQLNPAQIGRGFYLTFLADIETYSNFQNSQKIL
jgi:hypothetical protein